MVPKSLKRLRQPTMFRAQFDWTTISVHGSMREVMVRAECRSDA